MLLNYIKKLFNKEEIHLPNLDHDSQAVYDLFVSKFESCNKQSNKISFSEKFDMCAESILYVPRLLSYPVFDHIKNYLNSNELVSSYVINGHELTVDIHENT